MARAAAREHARVAKPLRGRRSCSPSGSLSCPLYDSPSGSPAAGSKTPLEDGEILGDGTAGCAFHRAIAADHVGTELRQRRRPAAEAPQCRADNRLAEQRVHALNQQPRRTVGHLHAACGFANRSAVADGLQDLNFSRPEGTIAAQVEAKEHACHGPYGTPRFPSGPDHIPMQIQLGIVAGVAAPAGQHPPCLPG
jgi:hypothetical protein